MLHALRKAHYLRELQALIDIEKEDWARKMQVLLRRACHATNLAREFGVALTARLIARIQRRYDAILAEGIAFHEAQPPLRRARRHGRKPRRVGHNLILRLQQHRDDVLRFLDDPDVPFTNTQAERDARMMKLRQKISGGFRSRSGADDFAIGGPMGSLSRLKAALDDASGVRDWRLHDLRRTARTLMSRAGVLADHAERCLGHVVPGIRGVYDHHEFVEEKRQAFEVLAAQIERIVNDNHR